MKATNIKWHQSKVSQEERESQLGKGCVLWFTGLSGSGKSTIATAVEQFLVSQRWHAFVLDGDNLRFGLNSDLGFSDADRSENIRRVGEVSALLAQANNIVLSAFISPFQKDRDLIRQKLPANRFLEIHVATSIDTCKERDPKGLYEKALAGQIPNFTGISSPYEIPENPELRLETQGRTVEECALDVIALLEQFEIILPKSVLGDL